MANIPLLYPGCTAQEILDTINTLIAAITDGAGQSISYKDLTDKPTLNGVEIVGNQTTGKLKIKIAETADSETYNETVASKAYVDAVEAAAVAAAQNAANAALADKLDKDLSNLESVTYMGENAKLLVITSDGALRMVSAADVAAYTNIINRVENSSLEAALKTHRKSDTITGVQDNSNKSFTTSYNYMPGTSAVYLNGVRMYAGVDYRETNNGFEFLTYTPKNTDIIIFEAVQLESRQ